MLELRPVCELCGVALSAESDNVRICTYECTFCADCATWQLMGICPNCSGELVVRPRRPAAKLAKDPASTIEFRQEHDVIAHQKAVAERLVANDLPVQLWSVAFANERTATDEGYAEAGNAMDALARQQPGFVDVVYTAGENNLNLTVSRWSSVAAMVQWRRVGAHHDAQQQGRSAWYKWYRSDVSRIERTAHHTLSR
jgi:uncharacterized protein